MNRLLLILAVVLGTLMVRGESVSWTFTGTKNSTANDEVTGTLISSSTNGTWHFKVSCTGQVSDDKTNGPRFGSKATPMKKGDSFWIEDSNIPDNAEITEVTLKAKGNAGTSASKWTVSVNGNESTEQKSISGTTETTIKWSNLNLVGNDIKLSLAEDATAGTHVHQITISYTLSETPPTLEAIAYQPSFDDLELTVGDSRSIAPASDNAAGKSAPAVSYAVSTGSDVISISGNEVTALAAGTATVKASWAAVENVWTAGETTFNVTVNAASGPEPTGKTTYKMVTSVDELKDGDRIVIAWIEVGKEVSMSNEAENKFRHTCGVTIENDLLVPGNTTLVLMLEGNATEGWGVKTVNYAGTNGYMSVTSSGSDQTIVDTKKTYQLTITDEIPIFKLSGTTGTSYRSFGYNYNNGNLRFAAYSVPKNLSTSEYFKNLRLFKEVNNNEYRPEFESPVEIVKGETYKIVVKADNATEEKPAPTLSYTTESDLISIDGDVITANAIGEGATVTAIWSAVEGMWDAGSTTFAVNVQPVPLKSVTLTWSENAAQYIKGQEFTAPTLTVSPVDAAGLVKYKSSAEDIATIDTTGELTVTGFGEAEITAYVEEDEVYASSSATYMLTSIDPDNLGATFDFADSLFGLEESKYCGADGAAIEKGCVKIELSGNVRIYNSTSSSYKGYELRSKKGNTTYDAAKMVFSVSEDYEITAIEFLHGSSTGFGYDVNVGDVATIKDGNTILSHEWHPGENEYASEVTFTAFGDANLRAINVTVQMIPEADLPDYTVASADVTEVTFKAVHPSHTLYYRTREIGELMSSYSSRRSVAAADLDGWTATETPLNVHTHVIDRTADDFTPYIFEVKSVDRKGNESGVVDLVVRDSGVMTGIEDIALDAAEDNVEYYNLQGVRLNAAPTSGFYLRREGGKVTKHVAK